MCVDTQDIQVIKIELHNTREAVLTTVELAEKELKLYTNWIRQKRNDNNSAGDKDIWQTKSAG